MGHVLGKNRSQITLVSLDELVDKNSPARQIDKLIDEADMTYFEKAEAKQTGRPPFDPKDMMKLYVYGFENGVHSSRKLERECLRNVEVMWLLKGLAPDDKTICNFRRENAANIDRFFKEFCKTLAAAGYIEGKIVSIDGTKIRANNSKRNNFSVKKLEKHIEYIDQKLAEYMVEVDRNDKIDALTARKAKYLEFKKRIEKGEVTEVSTTDPDSRLMRQGNNGVDVSYNVQAAVDSKHKMVTGALVTNEPNDQGQLYKVAKSVKDNLKLSEMTVPADKGYYKTEDFKSCHEENITTVVAVPEERMPEKGLVFSKQDFTYDRQNDCYHCPQGQVLRFVSEDEKKIRRYENRKACKGCRYLEYCTKGIRRVLTRHRYAEHAEQNDKDFAGNQEIYKLRQQLSEHPFGTVKRTMGIRQFLTRGLTNVTAEVALIFLCYNLKRLRNIHNGNPNNKRDYPLCYQVYAIICLFLMQSIYSKNIFAF